jgi:hypothetical protein
MAALLRDGVIAWRQVDLADVLFGHANDALLASILAIGLAAFVAIFRLAFGRRPGRAQIGLPALMPWARPSPLSWIRHAPLLLALAGLPFFTIALADPYEPLRQQEVSFPGRRIALLIDASASMVIPFQASRLNPRGPNQASFFTSVGGAEAFIRQRMKGKYRDLIALIEFGDQAYVVTPFTNDYANILLSLSLVGDWDEYLKFSDQGTTIGKAIDEGVALFRAFDFLDAAGNAMIIFSDGQDRQVIVEGRRIDDILAAARRAKVPVYLIRIGQNKALGDVVPDQIWQPAVEATGGRFYAAADESAIFRAISEIDRRSSGTSSMRSILVPLIAALLLLLAGVAFWTLGEAEEQVARVKTELATMDFGAVGFPRRAGRGEDGSAAADADDEDGDERSLAYAMGVPGLGRDLTRQVEDAQATADYWLARYNELALGRDAAGALMERSPELLLLAANAAYRTSPWQTGNRENAIEQLTAITRNYADVLKALGTAEKAVKVADSGTPEHDVLANAAYNYEFTVRLLTVLERARPNAAPAKLEFEPTTIHGHAGGPPENIPMEQFRVVIPRRSDERNQDPEGGQGQERIRKG